MANSKINRRWIIVIGAIAAIIVILVVILGGGNSGHKNGPGHHGDKKPPIYPPGPPMPSPPTPGPPPPSNTGSGDAAQWVNAHNKYRAMGNAPPVSWDNTLASYAQQWSNYMAQHGIFNHTCNVTGDHCDLGQNLHMNWGTSDTPEVAVSNWYAECPCYNGQFSETAGHYSQLMWKPVRKIGCAMAQDSSGKQYWTCYYDAAQTFNQGSQDVEKACGNCTKAAGCCASGQPSLSCCM